MMLTVGLSSDESSNLVFPSGHPRTFNSELIEVRHLNPISFLQDIKRLLLLVVH